MKPQLPDKRIAMNKLDDAVREELLRLSAKHDQEAIESVLSVVGQEYAPAGRKAPGNVRRDDLDLDDPEFVDHEIY